MLEGRFLNPYFDIAFVKVDVDSDAPCAKGTLTSDISVPDSPNSTIRRHYMRVTGSSISALIWPNATVKKKAQGSYAICLCDHTYFRGEIPVCSELADFSHHHVGWLHVKGGYCGVRAPCRVESSCLICLYYRKRERRGGYTGTASLLVSLQGPLDRRRPSSWKRGNLPE